MLHRLLVHNRLTAPKLCDWITHRSLKRLVLWVALSIRGFSGQPWLQHALLAAGLIDACVVLRIPVRR